MKRGLTRDLVEAAVLGGTILGGGGGGLIDIALETARLAVSYGSPQLWSLDELEEHDVVVVVAGVGAPGAPDQHVAPAHYVRSLDAVRGMLRQRTNCDKVVGLASNENGALGTINGWLQAAVTGLPVLDAPCNGRAHPTALMGSLGLHRDADYVSIAGFSGGSDGHYLEGAVSGRLGEVSRLVRAASIEAGGLVAVARNPVPVSRLAADGAPGAISQAIHLGQVLQARGVAAIAAELSGQVVAQGTVDEFVIEQRAGFDVGFLRIGDAEARFVNEYISVEVGGERLATFPELAMTFESDSGRPLVSAEVSLGQSVTLVVAPRDELLLSSTMDMPELMVPVMDLMRHHMDAVGGGRE
jgi:DUF917 family protein